MDIKCRKCRVSLPFDEKLWLPQNNDVGLLCCSSFEQILPIADTETKFPDWLETCLNDGDWCKGKIFCPKCKAKLGGFDFVNGIKCQCEQRRLLPEIHLNKRKIDIMDASNSTVSLNNSIDSNLMNKIKEENWPVLTDSVFPLSDTSLAKLPTKKTHRKTRSWHSTTTNILGGTLNTFLDNFLRRTDSSPQIHDDLCSTKKVDNSNVKQNQRIVAKKSNYKESNKLTTSCCSISVPDYLLCCICLELFCLPRLCMPCCHTYCEPCLRSLANHQQKATASFSQFKVHCPLCRQLIHFTVPNQELLDDIKRTLFDEYRLRLNWYKRQNAIKRFPLPGVESWAYVHGIFRRLPLSWSRQLTSRLSPLWTLYSFCLTFLCFVFFFICFIPAVYVSTYIYNYLEKFDIEFNVLYDISYTEISAFFVYLLSSGPFLWTFTFGALISSVILYLVFLW